MAATRNLVRAVAPCVAFAAAAVIGATPGAAAIIQQDQVDTATLQLSPGTPSGTLSCTGGTLTGLTGSGAGFFTDGGLFYSGLLNATGENCIEAGGTTGEIQLSMSGSTMFGGHIDCPDLSGSYVVLGGIIVTTLDGTCSILGVPITPSTLTTVGVVTASGEGVLTMAEGQVQPAA